MAGRRPAVVKEFRFPVPKKLKMHNVCFRNWTHLIDAAFVVHADRVVITCIGSKKGSRD